MYVIYGWGHKTLRYKYGVICVKCGNCGKKALFDIKTNRTWFSLFFIPIIPYDSDSKLICSHCLYESNVSGQSIKKIRRMKKKTELLLNHEITEDEYMRILYEAGIKMEEVSPSNDWECPKCNNVNVNTTYACKYCGYRIV